MVERAASRPGCGRRCSLRDAVAAVIFALTIAGVLTRPRGISEATVCITGAGLMLLSGAVTPSAAWHTVADQWDVLLFFAGLLLVSWASEEAGVFRWTALWAARLAHGSARRLFLNTFLAGVAVTTLLSNDATAILLTAIVVSLAIDLGLPVKPYALACAFIANSASLTLPVSNPLNILVLGSGGMGLGHYLAHLLPASVLVIGLTVLLFWLRFRGDVAGGFADSHLPQPRSAIARPRFFRFAVAMLLLLALAYLTASVVRWPLSIPVLVAGVLLLLASVALGDVPMRSVASAPWSIIPFVAGLLIVVGGLERTGLTHSLGTWLLSLEQHGAAAGVFGATAAGALGSNAINNLPMGAVMVSALRTAHAHSHPGLLYGTLLGCDVGPNLTVFGSLSSMLWLLLLRRRGISITAWEFMRWGLVVTPLLLVAGALAIVVVS